jgi:hypothetical protein
MASCADCGAPVRWGMTPSGARVCVDVHETFAGASRYLDRDGLLVAVRPEAADVLAFCDHRSTCPSSTPTGSRTTGAPSRI